MNIRHYSPRFALSELDRLNKLNCFFSNDLADKAIKSKLSEWTPKVDIHEQEHAFVIKADIPGVEKKDIDVSFENGMLTISGKRDYHHAEKESGKVIHSERINGHFSRSFSLPKSVDLTKIKAKVTDGVLKITVLKTSESIAKTIQVE